DPSGELCHPLPTLRSDPAAASAGQCDGGGGGGGDRGVGGWFGPDDSPDYGDVSAGYWTTADVWDFYYWAKAQPGDHVSGAEWIAAGRPKYEAPLLYQKTTRIVLDYTGSDVSLHIFYIYGSLFHSESPVTYKADSSYA